MIDRRQLVFAAVALLSATPATAQFTGPSVRGGAMTVAEAGNARLGRYVTLEGSIVSHLRGDYFRFSDGTGEIRVEIPPAAFGGRQIGPDDRVRILGEIDTGRVGRYVWVKSLTPL